MVRRALFRDKGVVPDAEIGDRGHLFAAECIMVSLSLLQRLLWLRAAAKMSYTFCIYDVFHLVLA
jgi:hypothetical protein